MISERDISIVVITRNRVSHLTQLLASFDQASSFPKEIIVITSSDNLLIEQASIKKFKKNNIRLIYQPPLGYASARNEGIKHSRGKIVAFVDDDCLVSPDFIIETARAHNRMGELRVVMGRAVSIPLNIFLSEVAELHYNVWLNTVCHEGECLSFDAKVSSFDRNIFNNKNLWFDTSYNAGSEDVELGHRMHLHGIQITYQPAIIVFHQERTSLIGIMKQRWRNAQTTVKMGGFNRCKLSNLLLISHKLADWIWRGKFYWCVIYVFALPFIIALNFAGRIMKGRTISV